MPIVSGRCRRRRSRQRASASLQNSKSAPRGAPSPGHRRPKAGWILHELSRSISKRARRQCSTSRPSGLPSSIQILWARSRMRFSSTGCLAERATAGDSLWAEAASVIFDRDSGAAAFAVATFRPPDPGRLGVFGTVISFAPATSRASFNYAQVDDSYATTGAAASAYCAQPKSPMNCRRGPARKARRERGRVPC
jgi:hypothetical protein